MHQSVGATQGAYEPYCAVPPVHWYRYSYLWLLFLITLLFSLSTQASTAADHKQPLPELASQETPAATQSLTEPRVAALVQQTATLLSAQHPGQQAARLAVNQTNRWASQAGERWLSRFGRARVHLGSDHNFKRFQGELAILLPLHEPCSGPLTFSQAAVHLFDKVPVINLGIGQRHLRGSWLFGYNAFIDQHLERPHTRLGIGAECWRDYLKLSANSYWALSSWRASNDFQGYEEKLANGFDLRLLGYWPRYPQLGMQLLLENYWGNQVALFGNAKESWQKDPLAGSIGLHYTPIPLVTIGVDHKIGSNSQKETRFNLQFDYLLDLPWEQQIDPQRVDLQRRLAFSKYDWVQRNNRLVMQYRELSQISLALPDNVAGYPGEQKVLEADVNARFGFKAIEWDSQNLTNAGGEIKQEEGTRYRVTLPQTVGSYPISGVAVDQQGNRSTPASSQITVNPWISLTLPKQIGGAPGETLTVKTQVSGAFKLATLDLDAEEFKKFTDDGGDIIFALDYSDISLKLPSEKKSYTLTVTAIDEEDHKSLPVTMTVIVGDEALQLNKTSLSGGPGEKQTITATVATGFNGVQWSWNPTGTPAPTLKSENGHEKVYEVTLPNTPRSYSLTGIAIGDNGASSIPVIIDVVVSPITINLPNAFKIPDTWLEGEEFTLEATGAGSDYIWKSSNEIAIAVDDSGLVTIKGVGSATITAESNGSVGTLNLESRPVLRAMIGSAADGRDNYDNFTAQCKSVNGRLVLDKTLDGAIINRGGNKAWAEITTWANKTFQMENVDDTAVRLRVWLDTDPPRPDDQDLLMIDLKTGMVFDKMTSDTDAFGICQIDP